MGFLRKSVDFRPGSPWQTPCVGCLSQHAEGIVSTRRYDDWTVDRWRLEPRLNAFELDDSQDVEGAPTLWKDLTVASLVALALWVTAAIVFG
jgi:hypothetical protein